ncbi:MAG TPA: hypothetical protein VIJ82_33240, partial [Streptosporangiaceae bacterium]
MPPDGGSKDGGPPGGHPPGDPGEAPPLTDAPDHDDGGACAPAPGPGDPWDDPDGDYDGSVLPAWPPLPDTLAEIPPFLGGQPRRHPDPAWPTPPAPASPGDPDGTTRRPAAGLLDLTISRAALTGAPAALGRLGPVSTAQALPLAVLAISNPAAQWRVILTNPAGHAIAVERSGGGGCATTPAARPASPAGSRSPSPPPPSSMPPPPAGLAGPAPAGASAPPCCAPPAAPPPAPQTPPLP